LPGPVPKPSNQRRRKNKPQVPAATASAGPKVAAPEPDPDWHPIAAGWFRSLAESGQSHFYESSDWATACYVAEAMSRSLKAGRFSGQLFAAVMAASTELLVTEGARRRLRVELERGQPEVEPASVAILKEYKAHAG
jgi:hypothetical protein